jgi:hypothetical protein
MATIAFAFATLQLIRLGDRWLGVLYLFILLLLLECAVFLWLKRSRNPEKANAYTKWSNFLFALEGVALGCWAFDLLTTFYAIDVTKLAFEVNPLGWPLGAMGAFSYYIPTVILTYFLLFRMKQKTSLFAAAAMSAVALAMGSMNLVAASGNLRLSLLVSMLPSAIRNDLLAIVVSVNIVFSMALVTVARRQFVAKQRSLSTELPS